LNILVSWGKEFFSNKKSTSQKATHSKIHPAPSYLYCDVFMDFDHLEVLTQYKIIPPEISSKILAQSNGWIENYAC